MINTGKKMKRMIGKLLSVVLSGATVISAVSPTVIFAEEKITDQTYTKTFYKFDDKSDYELTSGEKNQYIPRKGDFAIKGNYQQSQGQSIPTLSVDDGNLTINYSKIDPMSQEVTGKQWVGWTISEDKGKKVNNADIGTEIGHGAIIVQTSKDYLNWSTAAVKTDVFANEDIYKNPIYTTNDSQLNSGCYYRVIVAYRLEKFVGKKKILFVELDEYEYQKFAEVYEFNAYNQNINTQNDSANIKKYSVSSDKVLCEKFSGYYGQKALTKDDIHYGWDLGHFFISGYTSDTKDNANNPVFLKNVGDRVALWFNLEQDINALNGSDDTKITADTSGSDQEFETKTMSFGRGALFIRKTDYENKRTLQAPYTNFLEANVTPGTDTLVELFEEGDYEVALDYEVSQDKLKLFDKKLLDQTHHYRISFKFSVRNSNTIVYPLDVKTNEKLINGSYTKDGFYLDWAKSRYLHVNVKRSVLKDGSDEVLQDTYSNQLAKDGDKFTDEGLYTVTVVNQYINGGMPETKNIYVGDNDILKAHAVTGLSISEIKKKIAAGAKVNEDGTIGETISTDDAIVFAGLDDADLLTYVEDSVYSELVKELNDAGYFVENVEAKYVSRDYLENVSYNSQENTYFGYKASELNTLFNGGKYIYTLGADGKTTVEKLEVINDETTKQVMTNALVGTGVILVCATVSVVAAPAAPAISVIFAASASTGTAFGVYSGAFAALTAGAVRGYQTGDINEAMKSAAVAGSEAFKIGAISGAVTGGAKEALGLYKATQGGLTMNQVAQVQKETGYPLEVIKRLQNMDQVKILQDAGMRPEIINGKTALIRDIDLTQMDEFGQTNVERILNGLAPVDPSGTPYELHHVAQETDGVLAILTQEEHRAEATYSIWHANEGEGVHSQISNAEWTKIKKQFWEAYLKMKGYEL